MNREEAAKATKNGAVAATFFSVLTIIVVAIAMLSDNQV